MMMTVVVDDGWANNYRESDATRSRRRFAGCDGTEVCNPDRWKRDGLFGEAI